MPPRISLLASLLKATSDLAATISRAAAAMTPKSRYSSRTVDTSADWSTCANHSRRTGASPKYLANSSSRALRSSRYGGEGGILPPSAGCDCKEVAAKRRQSTRPSSELGSFSVSGRQPNTGFRGGVIGTQSSGQSRSGGNESLGGNRPTIVSGRQISQGFKGGVTAFQWLGQNGSGRPAEGSGADGSTSWSGRQTNIGFSGGVTGRQPSGHSPGGMLGSPDGSGSK
jgi:hypothetical protein